MRRIPLGAKKPSKIPAIPPAPFHELSIVTSLPLGEGSTRQVVTNDES